LALLGLLAEAWPDRKVRYSGQFIIDTSGGSVSGPPSVSAIAS